MRIFLKLTLQRRLAQLMLVALLTALAAPLTANLSGPLPAAHAAGATLTVNSSSDNTTTDGSCTLREAVQNIDNYNNPSLISPDCTAATGSGDTIVFSGVTNIVLDQTLGAFNINRDTIIQGPITLDGNNQTSILTVGGGANVSINAMTLQNGYSSGSGGALSLNDGSLNMTAANFLSNNADGHGGAIVNQCPTSCNLSLTNGAFTNNKAKGTNNTPANGGAIYKSGPGIMTITNVAFTGNEANDDGGAIYNIGNGGSNPIPLTTLTTGVAFTNNKAHAAGNFSGAGGSGEGGGAIFNDNQGVMLIVSNVGFLNNSVDGTDGRGGAIYNAFGAKQLIVNQAFFTLNNVSTGANGLGGAIYNRDHFTLVNSSFIGNTVDNGGSGGALASEADSGSDASVANTTFNNNTAKGGATANGGAIYQFGSSRQLKVYNVTIDTNTAANGGGLYNNGSTLTVGNTIISNNTGANCAGNNANPLLTLDGNNLEWPSANPSCNGAIVGDPKLNSPVPIPPQIAPSMTLNAGSAALNAGVNAVCGNGYVNNADQNSILVPVRPAGEPNCDIGAVESSRKPVYASNPLPGATITVYTTPNNPINIPVQVSNTGDDDLVVNNINVTGGPVLSLTTPTSFTIPANGASQTINVKCLSATTGTFSGTLSANHNGIGAPGSPVSYTINCIVVNPPTVAKSFSPATISVNGTSVLTFQLTNPNATPLTGVGFTDALNANIQVKNPNGLVNGCGNGTVTAANGNQTITVSGVSLTANQTCSISLNVTSPTVGNWPNTTGAISSTESGQGAVSNTAILNVTQAVVVNPPTVAKSFSPATITANGTTALSFQLTNPNPTPLTNVSFTDALNANIVVQTPNGLNNGCGNGSVTAVAGNQTITVSGINLAANQTCTITVNVTSPVVGSWPNTTGAISSTESGQGATSNTATLTVNPVPAPVYQSNPAPGATVNLTTNVNVPVATTINVTNPGTANLNITSIVLSNPTQFSLTTPASFTVTPNGAAQSVTVQCNSAVAGNYSTTVTVNHNAPGSPATYTVNCQVNQVQANSPIYQSNPVPGSSLNLNTTASTAVNATIVVSNGGTAALNVTNIVLSNPAQFSLTSPTSFSIPVGNTTQNIVVQCKSASPGNYSTTVTVSHNAAGSPATYTINCTVSPGQAPIYSSNPVPGSTVNLTTNANVPVATTINVTNPGTATLNVTNIVLSNPAQFSLTTPTSFSVAVNAASPQPITVQCNSAVAGNYSTTVTVSHNAPGSPATYTINCKVNPVVQAQPVYSSNPAPGSTTSLTTNANTPATTTIVVSNLGTATLNITGIVLSNPNQFSLTTPATFNIAAQGQGSPQPITIQCKASLAGSYSTTVTVNHNAAGSPAVYTINCTVNSNGGGGGGGQNQPVYGSKPGPGSTLNFGAPNVGSSATFVLQVFNTGTATLVVNSYSLSGAAASDFSLVSPVFPFNIPVGSGTVAVTLRCQPSAKGVRTALLSFATNAGGQSYPLICGRSSTKPDEEPPADLIPQLRVTPDRALGTNPDDLIFYQFKVKNVGVGEANSIQLLFPIDPQLDLAYATFTDPRSWVTKVTTDTVNISLPTLYQGTVMTGTLAFHPNKKAQAGSPLVTRYTVWYTDPTGTGKKQLSNTVALVFDRPGNDRDESHGNIQLAQAGHDSAGAEVYQANYFIPNEIITAWVTRPDGTSLGIPGGRADNNGNFALPAINPANLHLPSGTYVVAIYGNRSELTVRQIVTVP